ncbi:MAG: hypothetical protein L0H64_09465, partial [Pseudonocardia sp.]|nr:hypothetical protein [Pseudonocardia sp.]
MAGTTTVLPDHVSVPYTTPAEFAVRLAPRLSTRLDTGAPVLAVLDAPERAALESELGADAERVRAGVDAVLDTHV